MQLVYKFILKDEAAKEKLLQHCIIAKKLYNQALYVIRKELEESNKWLSYYDLDKIMKVTTNLNGEINYKLLKSCNSQQVLMSLSKNVSSYIKSIKNWSKHKNKYKGKPNFPKYLKIKYKELVYTTVGCTIKDGVIKFSKLISVKIPYSDKYNFSNFNQVRVIPKHNGRIVEIQIIYQTKLQNKELEYNRFASIDLGINNLVVLITDFSRPYIYSGKQLKSYNQFYNKQIAKYKSLLKTNNNKYNSNLITQLHINRENYISDIFHKISKNIVNLLVENKVGNLVVGSNKSWKDSIKLGNKTNQTFSYLPYSKLINYLKYKCELAGIKFVETEESYTSKCDSFYLEKVSKHEIYSGKRIKRGLFQSSTRKLINADVNGALNILRKVVDDSYVKSKIIDRGLLFRPVKFSNVFEVYESYTRT
ncbi:MAG: transposase [Bacteroidaceae bacterium]|nr:transposase [Bacteroidaceae bacterium]